jgi:hypothetical protein
MWVRAASTITATSTTTATQSQDTSVRGRLRRFRPGCKIDMRRRAYPRAFSGRLALCDARRWANQYQRPSRPRPPGPVCARLPTDPIAIITNHSQIGLACDVDDDIAAQGLPTQRRMREMNDARTIHMPGLKSHAAQYPERPGRRVRTGAGQIDSPGDDMLLPERLGRMTAQWLRDDSEPTSPGRRSVGTVRQ